jgi:acetyl esterase
VRERLGTLDRLKVAATKPLVKHVFASPRLRESLLRRRRADIARGFDPDLALLFVLGEITGDLEIAEKTPERARQGMLASVRLVDAPPAGAVIVREREVPGAFGEIPARLYEPDGLGSPSPGVLFVHGGGWVTGDLDTHDSLCRRIALEARVRVLAVAPRLAPEHPFPVQLDDTVAAFRHLATNAERYGMDAARLGVAGDSAGGNLSALVGLETRKDAVVPRATLLIYPAVDATCSMPSHERLGEGYMLTRRSIRWYLGQYLGKHDPRDPRVSPYHAKDLSGAPRALVVVAGFDPLVDEGEAYAKRLTEAGVTVEVQRASSMPHGFVSMTGVSAVALAETERMARRFGEILREG